jgi:hypothetical protein
MLYEAAAWVVAPLATPDGVDIFGVRVNHHPPCEDQSAALWRRSENTK